MPDNEPTTQDLPPVSAPVNAPDREELPYDDTTFEIGGMSDDDFQKHVGDIARSQETEEETTEAPPAEPSQEPTSGAPPEEDPLGKIWNDDIAKALGMESADELRLAVDSARNPATAYSAEQRWREVQAKQEELRQQEQSLQDMLNSPGGPWALAEQYNATLRQRGQPEIPPPEHLVKRWSSSSSANVPPAHAEDESWGEEESGVPNQVQRELAEVKHALNSFKSQQEQQRAQQEQQERMSRVQAALDHRTAIMQEETAKVIESDPNMRPFAGIIAQVVNQHVQKADETNSYPDMFNRTGEPEDSFVARHHDYISRIAKSVVGQFRQGISKLGESAHQTSQSIQRTAPASPGASHGATATPQNPARSQAPISDLSHDEFVQLAGRMASESESAPGSRGMI